MRGHDESREADAGQRGGARALLGCVLVGVLAFVASDAALRRSASFWEFAASNAALAPEAALGFEARATLLASSRPPEVLIVGSSLAASNIDSRELGRALDLRPGAIRRLWVPALSGLEHAFAERWVAEVSPGVVYAQVTPYVMLPNIVWERTRFYDVGAAWSLLGPAAIFRERGEHLTRTVESMHVGFRHRRPIRRGVLGRMRDITATPPTQAHGANLQLATLRAAQPSDFRCDSVHVAGLAYFARRMSARGVDVRLVPAPLRPGSAGADPTVRERFSACLGGLDIGGARLLGGAVPAPEFGERDFADILHLNRRGRERFTEWLAAASNAL